MNPARDWLRVVVAALSRSLHVFFGFGPCCRFEPTCSEYLRQAWEGHGFFKGLWLGAFRIARCHPWGGWGKDPVPGPVRKRG